MKALFVLPAVGQCEQVSRCRKVTCPAPDTEQVVGQAGDLRVCKVLLLLSRASLIVGLLPSLKGVDKLPDAGVFSWFSVFAQFQVPATIQLCLKPFTWAQLMFITLADSALLLLPLYEHRWLSQTTSERRRKPSLFSVSRPAFVLSALAKMGVTYTGSWNQ